MGSILITIPCLMCGGTEMQTLSLTKVLQSVGHAVFVVCYFEHDKSIIGEFQKTRAKVILFNLNRKTGFFKFIQKLRKEIYSIGPDVVHVQYMAPGALPIIAARLSGVKTVFATIHQPYTSSHGRLAKFILRTVSLLTTRFIVVSQNAERSWFGSSVLFDEKKKLSVQPHHFTIHNSVDIDKIAEIVKNPNFAVLRDKFNIPDTVFLIGAVSRLRYEKGIDLLIESFRLLIKEDINVHLLIVGSGPDEDKLKDQVSSGGINDKVTFYGAAEWEGAIRLMSIMDIVVVPSRFEGFGLTAAEAMAAGKAVIVSDSFGLTEVIADQKTGLTFKSEDIFDLKDKLKVLLNNPELCKLLGSAGRKRAKDLFDSSVFHKKIAALYNNNIRSIL